MKGSKQFQTRLLLFMVLLLVAVVGTVYLFASAAVNSSVRVQAAEQVEVGARVFQRLLEVRSSQLQEAVKVLAADFGFKSAIASDDEPTIRSVLLNHAGRIGASEVLLLDLDGRIVSSSVSTQAVGESFVYSADLQAARRGAQTIFLAPLNDQVHLLVETPVMAPVPIARVVMGFAMEQSQVDELRALTGLNLSLLAVREQQVLAAVSTLQLSPAAEQQLLTLPASTPVEDELSGEQWMSVMLPLGQGQDFQVQAYLHTSLNEAMQAFHSLDRDILLVTLAALAASVLLAFGLARTVSRPVGELVRVAERISQGDYSENIAIQREDEFGQLARVFRQMQAGIAERELQLTHNALHDARSGLPNRALALERIGSAILAERPIGLVCLGINNYRQLLDNLGEEVFEQLVQSLSQSLQAVLRPGDTVAQLTADEFVVLFDGADAEASVGLADRVQQILNRPLQLATQQVSLDLALGVAAYPQDGTDAESLLKRVDIARQDAMQLPGRLQVYQEGRDSAYRRQVELIRDLRHVHQQGGLLLHYQPKLDLRSNRVLQAEALLRWEHPQYGMVSPGEFIPLAERTGSISLLTGWVISEGVRQLAEWSGRGIHLQVSLNISADDLINLDLRERVAQLLEQYRVDPQQLVFEITESAVMQDQSRSLQVLEDLRRLGIGLSVDDFGTGYSSLSQLKRMPVQELKIDQSFVRDLDEHSEDAVIVRSTIEMSHSLGLKVVAEGVEYERSLQLLRRWGCDCVQGYFISRPLPPAAFESWLLTLTTATFAEV